MDKDNFGDRMKEYEGVEAMRLLDVSKPVMVRLDGRAFSTLTRGLPKPIDWRFQECMSAAARAVAEESNAIVSYTQSDEISLVLAPVVGNSQAFFGGRVQKICSVLASSCTLAFNKALLGYRPDLVENKNIVFDCRVWNVPTLLEAANTILWRHQDAVKNSISCLAQSQFSHKRLQGLNGQEKMDLLVKEKSIDWNEFDHIFKFGELVVKRVLEIPFSPEEIDNLPLKHEARKNPNLLVRRSKMVREKFPSRVGGVELSRFLFGDMVDH